MRVAITGASGLVGKRLLRTLQHAGHEPIALLRAKPGRDVETESARLHGVEVRAYDPFDVESTSAAIKGCEGIVNLAGENIFARRWNKAFLQTLRDSRVLTTRALVQAIRAQSPRPAVLVSSSAVGFYGPRAADEPCVEDELETSFPPRDPLAGLCREWEGESRRVARYGVRDVRLRTGVVLAEGGGALSVMETPFKLGVGGRVGKGTQVMSWIHLDDLCRMIEFALTNPDMSGPYNATAPHPVTNAEFTKALGAVLSRPTLLPIPALGLRVMLGQVASVVTTGQRATPDRVQALGFRFHLPRVEEALSTVYLRKQRGWKQLGRGTSPSAAAQR